ncbi:16S rRNA (uracil(1498)-N(3))-methyltransferase [Sulfuricaulis sp.]|jgi:16S rRNA (uracil1498-N3)-methyltransferase|uniref:RsmE family RNA methyltransferase n=1 Tax=Sulfuricaulis sp. TaxID=2003553 RepID=UPI00355A8DD5
MAEPLFYSERLADPGATLTLTGDEARHAVASRRLQVGETLWLFDGRGGLARATLLHITARGHALDLRIEERRAEPPPKPAIHLACALPKGDRQGTLLDMATQLGITEFTPLACERSVVRPGANSAERWWRICLEACKQSRRPYLPILHAPATPQEIVVQEASRTNTVWIAHPSAAAVTVSCAVEQNASADVTILVGPEGGFTEGEVERTTGAGAQPIALGSAILRIETAAVALVAAFSLATRSRTP